MHTNVNIDNLKNNCHLVVCFDTGMPLFWGNNGNKCYVYMCSFTLEVIFAVVLLSLCKMQHIIEMCLCFSSFLVMNII